MSLRRAWAIALAVFIIDQIVKYVMVGPLDLEAVRQIELLPIFNLTWVENRGISLGMLQADGALGRWLLVGATAAIAVFVGIWLRRERHYWDRFALALVLGGALGNIVDRARLGYVIDYADLHFGDIQPFYVFNIADAAISIGVVILLVRAFFFAPKENEDHA